MPNDGTGKPLIRRLVTYAIAAVAFVAIMLGFSPRAQWPQTVAIALGTVALLGGLLAPPIRRAALQRRRAFIWTGVAIIVLGVGAIPIGLAYPSAVSADVCAGTFVALFLVGFMVAGLPQMSMNLERANQVQKSLGTYRIVADRPLNPATEAVEALRAPVDQPGPFIRVVGPWLAAFCALLTVLAILDLSTAKAASMDRSQAMTVLLVFLGLILAGLLILLLAAIQWTRFVGTGQEPALARVPGRALWGWTWRLFIFAWIFRFGDKMEPWLRQHLPSAEHWELHALTEAVLLCLSVLVTPFAISLTSVALGDPGRAIEARGKIVRATGRKIYVGAAIVLAPYFLISWALDTFGDQAKGTAAHTALGYVYLIIWFLTVIAFFGYIARLYARVVAATERLS